MDAFTSLYVWQMMYLQMRLYDENFGEKFSSYRRIFAQISMWDMFVCLFMFNKKSKIYAG